LKEGRAALAPERHGSVEITEVRRQREEWQRDATRHLATGRTADAIDAYAEHDAVHVAATREVARSELIDRWNRERQVSPDVSRIILTHTNAEVRELNVAARERLQRSGTLGGDMAIVTERGTRSFAPGDRIMFLKNERSLGVKNGSLGNVQSVTSTRIAVMLDDGRSVAFDIKDYAAVDHGYAATIHKTQGVTVDRAHVLATPGLDRHAAYVALSRHRDRVDLHYGSDDFADRRSLVRALSRDRAKDMASDFATAPARRDIQTVAQPRARSTEPMVVRKAPIEPEVSPLDAAVRKFARATADIVRMRKQGLSELPHQQQAFERATAALNALRPDGSHDLAAQNQPPESPF
jgi:ATP-dependent exoDNAse (exonuclease V) alpha subunit